MLRALVGLALLANLFWFAGTQGWLPAAWLPLPDDAAQREPRRLAQQVRPEAVTVRPEAADRAAPACLQSAPLADDAALAAAEAALIGAGVPAGRWTRVDTGEGPALRVDGIEAGERDALRRAAQDAGGAVFSRCP